MKKLFATLASVLMVAVLAVSMAACSQGERIRVLDIPLSGERYGFTVSQNDAELMTAVNSLIEDLCGSAPFDSNDPENDHGAVGVQYDLDGDGTEETVTFATLYAAIQEDAAVDGEEKLSVKDVYTDIPSGKTEEDCLIVATNAQFKPFEYKIGNGLGGIDMHIAKMLANQLGNKTLVVKDMEFDVVIQNVGTGQADIGMAGLTISEGRAESVNFSDPYFETSQSLAVLESDTTFDGCTTREDVEEVLAGLQGAVAGAANGQTGYWYLVGSADFAFDGFSNVETKSYTSLDLALQDLSNGKVDFVIGDKDPVTSISAEINGRIPVEE